MEDNIQFSTKYNYQKIANMDHQTNSVAAGNTTTVSIPHSAGRISSVRAWYDPGTGRRFPVSDKQYSDASTSASATNNITARTVYLTTTNLVINYANLGASAQNVTTYYRVYYDN